MRPIARQSARLANYSGARRSSQPWNKHSRSKRQFHTAVRLSQEPRSPSGSSDPQTPLNEWREHSEKFENGVPQQEEAAEQGNGEAKTAHEGRKFGMRRTLRQKRMNDVPKPPPIPDWFLKHNVRLLRESPGLDVDKECDQVVRCVDKETGHTLFTVPYVANVPLTPPTCVRGMSARSRSTEQHPAAEAEGSTAPTADSKDTLARQRSRYMDLQFFRLPFDPDHLKQIGLSEDMVLRNMKMLEDVEGPKDKESLQARRPHAYPIRWPFLEAETSIRASLSLANENNPSVSFATDRVDLSLQCPDPNSHKQMDEFVDDLARIVQADLIRLDVNDFAELTEDYVGQGHDEPGSFSTLAYDVYDGYEAAGLRSSSSKHAIIKEDQEDEFEEDEDEDLEDDEHQDPRGSSFGPFASMNDLRKALQDRRSQLGSAIRTQVIGIGIGIPKSAQQISASQQPSRSRTASPNAEMNRDDARLAALLEGLLDAPKQKQSFHEVAEETPQSQQQQRSAKETTPTHERDSTYQRMLRYWLSDPAYWTTWTAKSFVAYLERIMRDAKTDEHAFELKFERRSPTAKESPSEEGRPKSIVHVRDLRDIFDTPLGESILNHLVRVVRKRRRAGQQIVIVGTTAQDVPGPVHMRGDSADDFPFRTLTVPPFFKFSIADAMDYATFSVSPPHKPSAYWRIMDINLRHIQRMLRRMRPDDGVDLLSAAARDQLTLPGINSLAEKVLPLDHVQRISLVVLGLLQSHALANVIQPIHVGLAAYITTRCDHAMERWTHFKVRQRNKKSTPDVKSAARRVVSRGESSEARIDRLKKICNPHETRLLSGMVDPRNIKTGFTDVHAPTETIDALKTLTTLSLLRPEAFSYGVLADDRLPGLLLYGPPGTGKTLLAKAVAKESKATVLEVSGAQIYEKYVGEGEKMVRAVFSLAKKLSPCVVFIDEADAIFGSRSGHGNRNTHREIINQFLREWDGMDDHSVFMMVASNRPFDLDDAVLRRLPRRLLVDLPVAKDREAILGIHLKNEALDESVSLSKLAEQTPLYSGSDLKNLAVAAALACVREENESADAHKEDKEFKLPEKRTLNLRHFDKALLEISASISENMTSLTAIRKFDEQYGDRRGRRKKTGYGFGATDGVVDEGAARVRPPTSSPAPPGP